MYLDFEEPLLALENKLAELRHSNQIEGSYKGTSEIQVLEKKIAALTQNIYKKLTPYQRVQVARHEKRPHVLDYIQRLVMNYEPLSGDRCGYQDAALVGGVGLWAGRLPVVVVGHEKGATTEKRIAHSFGMPRSEGYRVAARLFQMAHDLGLAVVTLVDTPGGHPGPEAEERCQAYAIASCIQKSLGLGVPNVSVIVGEGGSGGAIALATANSVMMLENSVYSVISPEGCASILWRSKDKAREAAQQLHLTSSELKTLGVVDKVITEPLGGAHRNTLATIDAVGKSVESALKPLLSMASDDLAQHRWDKFACRESLLNR